MRPIYITKSLSVAADDNGICLSQTPGAAGAMVIAGAFASGGVATMDTQRQVLFTFAADESGHTFTITGTDDQGHVISEDVAGGVGTATTVLDYKTVTEILIDAAATGAIIVGTNGVGSSPPIPLDQYVPDANISLATILRSGAVNWTVQYTYDDVFAAYAPADVQARGAAAGDPTTIVWWDHASLTTKAADTASSLAFPVKAVRIKVNSGTGQVELQVVQQGTQ